MLNPVDVWKNGSREEIWNHFCGFQELSMDEFLKLQESMLMEQIKTLAPSKVGKLLMGDKIPRNAEEFRQTVPLTNYSFYESFLSQKDDDFLPVKPYTWGCSSGTSGARKWIPLTQGQYDSCVDLTMGLFILSTATDKGKYTVKDGDIFFGGLPPAPYLSGILVEGAVNKYGFRFVPPMDEEFVMSDLPARSARGFKMGLSTGLDFIVGLPSVMARMGGQFSQRRSSSKGMPAPKALFRILKAVAKSKLAGRPMLPRDMWKLKTFISGGMDLAAFKERIEYYWGTKAYEIYVQGEFGGIIALPTWKREGMIFQPYGAFLEFIPESEVKKNREDPGYQPATCLLNELEAGKCYEIVFTNFYGSPFARYRPGDMVEVTRLDEPELGIKLPQILVKGRADKLIDLGGFTRLDERTIWLAMEDAQVNYEDWMANKETGQENPVLHLYISSSEEKDLESLRQRLHASLKKYDTSYAELEDMLGWDPLRVSILPLKVFEKWEGERIAAGADPAFVKDQRMQPPEYAVKRILEIAKESET